MKDWHGITRQDNLIGDMTWNSSSKHDCIALASLHCSQIPIVSECWAAVSAHLYLSRNLSAWYHRSSVILPLLYWIVCKYLEFRTQLNNRSKHVGKEILTGHIFHIDVCSDHSLDNLLILSAYFKTQVMNFCKNKQ